MTNDQTKEVIQKRWKLPVANQQETKEVIMATDRVVVAEGLSPLGH
jgi:hypothetical protein